MATTHGGKRPGAGRPKKDRTPAPDAQIFESAEEYLQAVVAGTVPPDTARISAARCLISYQKSKQRAPKKSPTPTEIEAQGERDLERATATEFEKKAEAIRAKHQAKKEAKNVES